MSNTTTKTNPEAELYDKRAEAADRRAESATTDFDRRVERSNADVLRWHARELRGENQKAKVADPAGKPGKSIWFTDDLAFPIDLRKEGNRLVVVYGKQVDRDLNYSEACTKLGEAILHALCSEGNLNPDRIRSRPRSIGY